MINHHPDDNYLVEFASGSLPWALSLSVSAHLQMCPCCRQKVVNLNKIGGAMLTASVVDTCPEKSFEQLMQRIKATPSADKRLPSVEPSVYSHDKLLSRLPKVIAKLLPYDGKLKWKRMSSALKMARLKTGQDDYEVAFHCITSGGNVVEHDHRGLEVTLVLQGSFSDEKGVYNAGDFLVRHPGEIHRPTATQNQDCLCLSVVAAPVRVTGWLGHFINPFLSIRPA